jgi:integrase
MAVKINITRKDKFLDSKKVFYLLDVFINEGFSGKRTRKDGKRISTGSVVNYVYIRKHLLEFEQKKSFELKIYIESNLTYKEKINASLYYKKFYLSFTKYLYDENNYFDNYVGNIIKGIRCFFNYLEVEKKISIGMYHKSFYIPREEIPIISLSIDQLNYIIYNKAFNSIIEAQNLEAIRDTFVFGCTVALRVSDLLQLTIKNLAIINEKYYIRVKSQKTSSYTSIKLPDYAVDIIKKYDLKDETLLPKISPQGFNQKLKYFAKFIPDDFQMIKLRERRGKQIVVYKDPKKKVHYNLSDHVTSHTMRRTAITTMLNLGMPEHVVRKISGHAANSREFFRYVQLSQNIIDQESDKVFEQIKHYKSSKDID